MKNNRFIFALALLATAGLATADVLIGAAVPHYEIVPLGDLGDGNSLANAINASGQMAGGSYDTAHRQHGIRWSPAGQLADLGLLGTDSLCTGNAIDGSGAVAGFSGDVGLTDLRAVLVPAGGLAGTMATLGSLTSPLATAENQGDFLPGDAGSEATGLDGKGTVVGYSYTTDATGNLLRAFYWTAAQGMVALPLPTGTSFLTSSAAAINAQGVIVGRVSHGSSHDGSRAVRWVVADGVAGEPKNLGTLGGSSSEARAINAAGQIVGNSLTASDAEERAFLYDETAVPKMRELGELSAGTISNATGINVSGQIVGTVTDAAGARAFLYTEGVLYALDQLVPSSGWTQTHATGINDAGEIAGWGKAPDGRTLGFVLRPLKAGPPYVRVDAPTLRSDRGRKFYVKGHRTTIRGTMVGQVTSVTYRVGRKPARLADSTSGPSDTPRWVAQTRLKLGRNKVVITAHGPGGDSAPLKLTIISK